MATTRATLGAVSWLVVACAPAAHAPSPPSPAPACAEVASDPAPWPRSTRAAAVVPGAGGVGHLTQSLGGGEPVRLTFLGAHLFDLLDKIEHEAGPREIDRRRLICAALNAAAAEGAPVVRLWGSLKRTGSAEEVERAASLLALVLDEDARRARPLRFIVTLMNHQGGYGAPRPEASLDDQDPEGPWSARRIYLDEGFRARGVGQLSDRIDRFAKDRAIASSPYVLAWELVNELDTFRSVAGGALAGPEADALRDRFLVPLLTTLAERFSQPIMVADLRGAEAAYAAFARGLIARLPAPARAKLVWTSHVYASLGARPEELAEATRKLDLDLAIAAEHGLPFVLGEIGQRAPGAAPFCGEGLLHDPAALLHATLDPPRRKAIDAALFWGEGQCGIAVPGTSRVVSIGAGGDSADIAPGDSIARAALRSARASGRFRVMP